MYRNSNISIQESGNYGIFLVHGYRFIILYTTNLILQVMAMFVKILIIEVRVFNASI